MARISGVNIPTNKKVSIGLTYIHGIGDKSASDICEKAGMAHTELRVSLEEIFQQILKDLWI